MGQVARGFTDRTQLSVSGIHLFGLHAEFDSSGVLASAQNKCTDRGNTRPRMHENAREWVGRRWPDGSQRADWPVAQ